MMIPGLGKMILNYLTLMGEFDNEDITEAFENIMVTFAYHIQPYAYDIC